MFALLIEVNEILRATPPNMRRETGMCVNAAIIIYGNAVHSSIIRVLVFYVLESRASRSRCSIPGTWYAIENASTKRATESEVRGSVSRRAEKLLVSRDYPITCYKQSNAFLTRRRRSFPVSPWNVDPLRSTTLRGIRSARRRRGNSSA